MSKQLDIRENLKLVEYLLNSIGKKHKSRNFYELYRVGLIRDLQIAQVKEFNRS